MNVYIPYTRLPSAYQEVEYIESTGTQYIDTGVTFNTNYAKIELDLMINSKNGSFNYLYATQSNSDGWMSMEISYSGTEGLRFNTGNTFDILRTSFSYGNRFSVSVIYNNGTQTVNGVSSSYSGHIPYNTPFRTDNGGGSSIPNRRIYGLKIYSTSSFTLVRDLVPCYRKSDNVIGMYDLVNDQFYTNSGTGTFSKGNDVTMSVLKNIYIGEYKGYSVDFTTATAASLQADGFTTYGNLGLDSNGMYVSSGDNAECGVYKAVDLTGCSKFTLKFYSSLTSGSWAGGPNLGIGAISGSSFTSPYSWLNFRSNSNSGYCGEQLFYENSIIAQNTTAKSNGDYTTTIVYDFSNSTVSVTTTGPTPASYSASLSSAQVSALTQNRYVKYGIGVGGWSAGRYNRLKKVERIIE